MPLKAEKKSRSSKRRLDVNLRKRTRADCGELLRRVRVKGTHRLYKAATRRFLLQIDTRTKRQQMENICRDGPSQKKLRRVHLQDCHLRTVSLQVWARCNCHRFREFWSLLTSERGKTAIA